MLNNKEKLLEIVERVMSEMFFLFPDVDDNGNQVIQGKPSDDSMQAGIRFNSRGGFVFKVDRILLIRMASNFMGILPDRVEEDHIKSMVAEIANIIGGIYLKEIDPEGEYDLSTPEVIESDMAISSAEWRVNFVNGGYVLTVIPAYPKGKKE